MTKTSLTARRVRADLLCEWAQRTAAASLGDLDQTPAARWHPATLADAIRVNAVLGRFVIDEDGALTITPRER